MSELKAPAAAFAGLRVVERATGVAAAYCARLLADLGADVIKVEPPAGDPSRRIGPFPDPAADFGAVFLYCNSDKRGITLDDRLASGLDVLQRLLARAAVVITDADRTELDRLGLSPAQLSADHPALVAVSIRPYGLDGPLASRPGTELDVYHASGEGSLLPGGQVADLFPDRAPVKAGRWLVDYDSGITAATAVVAALIQALVTGRGDFIEVSQQEAELTMNRLVSDHILNQSEIVTRSGRRYDFGGMFRCRDGWINLRPNEDNHWATLAEGMGVPELATDPRFASRAGRVANAGALNQVIAGWAIERDAEAIYEQLGPRGTPVGIYADAATIKRSPQLRSRGWFADVDVDGRPLTFPGVPYLMSETPGGVHRRAPHLGEHNAEVYSELDLSAAERSRLREAGLI
jgi:crotonobetainyl-CoA:carnitine CoA-transferase CaiB-like acyl-CoA transferase